MNASIRLRRAVLGAVRSALPFGVLALAFLPAPLRAQALLHTLAGTGGFGVSTSAVPDADGDGLSDLLVGANHGDRAYLYSGATGALLRTLQAPGRGGADSWFGYAVAGVPDVDGDGRGDLLVGAPKASRALVFSGASGDLLYVLTSPYGTPWARFGAAVAGVEDVDGDGRGDLLIGARREGPGMSTQRSGRAYVFSGATGALLRELASPRPQSSGHFGFSVAGVPDADGDGRSDLLVGAPDENLSGSDAGLAYLFGGATGALLHTLIPNDSQGRGRFGHAVAGVEDADGDGRGDLLVGAPDHSHTARWAGRAFLFSGATGEQLLRAFRSPYEEREGDFGHAVAGVPDADGDGRGDLLIGDDEEGRALLFSGAGGQLLHALPALGSTFGSAVSGVPDVDGDGRGDLLVGARAAGRAYLFSGAAGPAPACAIAFAEPTAATFAAGGVTVSGSVANTGPPTQARLRVRYERVGGGASGALAAGPQLVPTTGGAPFAVTFAVPSDAPVGTYALTYELVDRWGGGAVCDSQGGSVVIAAPRSGSGGAGAPWEGGALSVGSTTVEPVPGGYALERPAPNPFTASARLAYALPEAAPVRLAVYDLLGREVAVLVDGAREAGRHEAVLDGRRLPAGVYRVRLSAGPFVHAHRVTVLH